MSGRRPYFSERHGRGPRSHALSVDALRKLVFNVWDTFDGKDYLQEAFGHYCVDAGIVAGTVGTDPEAYFIRVLGREHMWPYRDADTVFETAYDRDAIFDMVEALHDLVSKPVDGRYHSFSDCGWHYAVFDRDAGRAEYREEINSVLRLCDPPYELTPDGEIIQATPDEFRPLMSANVPGTDHDAVTERVEAAKRTFANRHSSPHDRRMAIVELAAVLEALRDDVKAKMTKKDEGDLFNLANRFALRHNDPSQQRDYDTAIWHRWMFYVYLATIHAVLRVQDRPTG